jgi:O-antigen/teichoic acid export membrane protein
MSIWRFVSLISSLIGTRVAGAAFGLTSQILLARAFAPSDVGMAFLAMSAMAFISLLMTAGYPALAITYLARYQTLGRKSLIAGFFAAARRDTMIFSLITYSVLALAYFVLPLSNEVKTGLIFGGIAAIPYALVRLNNSAANALRRFSLSYVPDFMLRPALLLIFIVVMVLALPGYTIGYVLWAFVAIALFVAVLQAILLGRHGATAGMDSTACAGMTRLFRGRALPLVIVGLVSAAFADIVTLLAGLFLSASDIAVLGVAIRLAALAGFVTQASQQFVMRDLTAAMARGTKAEVDGLLFRTNAVALGVMFGAILGMIVLGDKVLAVFGQDYQAGLWPLVLFMVSQAVRAASGMNGHLLSLSGHQIRTAGACLIAVLVLAGGTALLAPRHGIIGVALAVIAADAVWAASLAVLAGKLAGRRGDIFAVAPVLVRRS